MVSYTRGAVKVIEPAENPLNEPEGELKQSEEHEFEEDANTAEGLPQGYLKPSFSLLQEPTRRAILKQLTVPTSPAVLKKKLGLYGYRIYWHLQILHEAGMVAKMPTLSVKGKPSKYVAYYATLPGLKVLARLNEISEAEFEKAVENLNLEG